MELDERQCFTRERVPKTDFWTTAWGEMLVDPNCVVDHFKFIHNYSDTFFGATKDLQVCADDKYRIKITQ